MSETLVCEDAHLDRPVVVKFLKPDVDPKRLLDEVSALSAIRSKHVVQVYDVIRDKKGAVVAIVEEYLAGDVVEGAPAPKDAHGAIKLLYPIATGIADIHAHGRVHRDIKPSNMRYDADGCLKIFDFGLAKISLPVGTTKNLYFSKGFTPPEAFDQNSKGEHVFTQAVDAFAFGSTAYSVLSGGVLPNGFLDVPPKLGGLDANFSVLPQKIPAAISDALNRCLLANPDARPEMADIQSLLGSYLLFDKHRASLVFNEKESTLHAGNRRVKFALGAEISVTISYDGLAFMVTEVAGAVFINNIPVSVGFILPGACVIVLGLPSLGRGRGMVAVSVSHPEVTL